LKNAAGKSGEFKIRSHHYRDKKAIFTVRRRKRLSGKENQLAFAKLFHSKVFFCVREADGTKVAQRFSAGGYEYRFFESATRTTEQILKLQPAKSSAVRFTDCNFRRPNPTDKSVGYSHSSALPTFCKGGSWSKRMVQNEDVN
jgi:hypothetical protein